ncbi:MAG: DUF3566 domain-containing protein [Candidatus Zixiibacteriota bacterium]
MRYELKKIEIWPLFKVSFIINLPVGFILGLFWALSVGFFISVGSSLPGIPQNELSDLKMSMGVLFIFIPIMAAIFGAIFHTLILSVLALIYNLTAKLVGGLEFNFNLIEEPPAPAYYPPSSGYATPPPPVTPTSPPPLPTAPTPNIPSTAPVPPTPPPAEPGPEDFSENNLNREE